MAILQFPPYHGVFVGVNSVGFPLSHQQPAAMKEMKAREGTTGAESIWDWANRTTLILIPVLA